MEAEIGSELFKFIRNIMTHFSFFNSWNDICISRQIINWNKEGQSVDKFLKNTKAISKLSIDFGKLREKE